MTLEPVEEGAPASPRPWEAETQALVRLVPHGGARNARRIAAQWRYLSRRGRVELQRSERHFGVDVGPDKIRALAASWAAEAGRLEKPDAQMEQAITTHIVVSFPPGTHVQTAFQISRAWAEEVFGSGRHGGTFDYVTACHTDRPHPHMHLVVNRRAFEGTWLKIAHRHPDLNYVRLREMLVEIAGRYGVDLEATSREARGLSDEAYMY